MSSGPPPQRSHRQSPSMPAAARRALVQNPPMKALLRAAWLAGESFFDARARRTGATHTPCSGSVNPSLAAALVAAAVCVARSAAHRTPRGSVIAMSMMAPVSSSTRNPLRALQLMRLNVITNAPAGPFTFSQQCPSADRSRSAFLIAASRREGVGSVRLRRAAGPHARQTAAAQNSTTPALATVAGFPVTRNLSVRGIPLV